MRKRISRCREIAHQVIKWAVKIAWKGNQIASTSTIVPAFHFYVYFPYSTLSYCKPGTRLKGNQKRCYPSLYLVWKIVTEIQEFCCQHILQQPFRENSWPEGSFCGQSRRSKKTFCFSSRLEAFLNRFVPPSNIDRHTLGNRKKWLCKC